MEIQSTYNTINDFNVKLDVIKYRISIALPIHIYQEYVFKGNTVTIQVSRKLKMHILQNSRDC